MGGAQLRVSLIVAALLALASPASAHCYRVWHYPWAQPGCPSRTAAGAAGRHGRREVMRIEHARGSIWASRTPLDTRADQRVRPDPPDALREIGLAITRPGEDCDASTTTDGRARQRSAAEPWRDAWRSWRNTLGCDRE